MPKKDFEGASKALKILPKMHTYQTTLQNKLFHTPKSFCMSSQIRAKTTHNHNAHYIHLRKASWLMNQKHLEPIIHKAKKTQHNHNKALHTWHHSSTSLAPTYHNTTHTIIAIKTNTYNLEPHQTPLAYTEATKKHVPSVNNDATHYKP